MAIYPETDKTMLERIISGDEISWSEFYGTYAPVVKKLCRIYHVSDDAAEDVVQEVMLHFSKQSGSYHYAPEYTRFRTYFNRIVRGAIADWYRKNTTNDLPENFAEKEFQLPVHEAEELQLWRKIVLEELLDELSHLVQSKTFLAFTMSTLDGKSISETADFLQLTTAEVYVARSRCAAKLRKLVRRCSELDPELELPAKGF